MSKSRSGSNTILIRRRDQKKGGGNVVLWIFVACVVLIGAVGGGIYIKKYAPTREHMPLVEYYHYYHDDEAALIIDDEYVDAAVGEVEDAVGADASDETGEEAVADGAGEAIVRDGRLYLSRDSLKERIDDGYVFDDTEGILRYATDVDLISVPYGEAVYSVNGEEQGEEFAIVVLANDKVYVAADFANRYSDFSYTLAEDPYRAVIYNAHFKRDVATLGRNAAIRRLGGPKSKVLKDAKKGETVSVTKNWGKWSSVVSEDGVIGYLKNSQLRETTEREEEARLPERVYQHKTMPGTFFMGWNIITFAESNRGLSGTLSNGATPDVLAPTWLRLSGNKGEISDISDKNYIKTCHERGILVWGLVSDFEEENVNTTKVLNRTSNRDRLVKNIISAATDVGMDGINVDFERVSVDAADGFAQFIRELSLECEKQDLFLSVDNYIPAEYNRYYNRSVQNDYADYVVVMAYDEHHRGGGEAGSNASLPFVKEAVEATREEVDAERLILGMPFFCREWIAEGEDLSSAEYSMRQVPSYLSQHELTPEWDEDLGQNYTEYTDGDARHMLWIEDEESLSLKLDVLADNKLAGGAFWAMGFEPGSVWETIDEYR